ncbi:Probable nucleoside-diphosphate-sugar epimerase [gamma proteobacterium HdN1]|nr:Probable nucleoside-diphosphate-sugar epimerase [gamma proteobacterium HdN1]
MAQRISRRLRMKVVIWGATGLTGGACLERLLEDARAREVVAPTRRPLGIEHPKLINLIADFDNLAALQPTLEGAVVAISCLGTTIKKAGSKAAFRQVDFEYSLAAAQICRVAKVQHWLQVSAIGASSRSPVFYSRVKGELEGALHALRFPLLSIFHPSMLMGDREESRPLEELGIKVTRAINPLLLGPLKSYRGIEDEQLAAGLVNRALIPVAPAGVPLVDVFSYEKIVNLAGLSQ